MGSHGVARGALWLTGGVCFEYDGAAYLNFGSTSSADGVQGLVEIVGSEYEAAREQVIQQRKAA